MSNHQVTINDAKLGKKIIIFKRTVFRSIFACLVVTSLIFTAYWSCEKMLFFILITLILLAMLGIYIAEQLTSRLILCEFGLQVMCWRKKETMLWSEIKERFARYSVIADPYTLIELTLTSNKGKKIVIPNNWKPNHQFYVFVSLLLQEGSLLLSPNVFLTEAIISDQPTFRSGKDTFIALLKVINIFFFPILIIWIVMSRMTNNLKTMAILTLVVLTVWFLFFVGKED